MFLHSSQFLESESQGIHHEYCFCTVYSVTLVHFDSNDEQDKKDQEAIEASVES